MNTNLTPERLLNEQYLIASSSFQIFQHHITEKIDIHWHEFFEIAFVVSGTGTHLLNGEIKPLKRGMMFLLTPADFHAIIPDPGETIYLYDLIFEGQYIRYEVYEMIFGTSTNLMHSFPDSKADLIEGECERIWEEFFQSDLNSEVIIQGALERMIVDLIRICRKYSNDEETIRSNSKKMHPSVRRALAYIHHHFREQITLQEVAAHVGLSVNYFSECFHQQVLIPYQIYLQKLRLQFASSLLRSTHIPITEVCYASGFNTISHFERVFKQRYACTPRAYRREVMMDREL